MYSRRDRKDVSDLASLLPTWHLTHMTRPLQYICSLSSWVEQNLLSSIYCLRNIINFSQAVMSQCELITRLHRTHRSYMAKSEMPWFADGCNYCKPHLITSASIANWYVLIQKFRFVISDQSVLSQGGSTKGCWPYKEFYNALVATMKNMEEEDLGDLLAWWQEYVFLSLIHFTCLIIS